MQLGNFDLPELRNDHDDYGWQVVRELATAAAELAEHIVRTATATPETNPDRAPFARRFQNSLQIGATAITEGATD